MSDDAPDVTPTEPAAAPAAAAPSRPAPVAPAPQAPAQPAQAQTLADQGVTPALLAQLVQQAQGQQQRSDDTRHATDSDKDISRLPQWAQSMVNNLRSENMSWRHRYKEADEGGTSLRKAIAEAAGLDVAEVSVDSLNDLFGYVAGEAHRNVVTTEAMRAAVKHGADVESLLNWAPFLDSADGLDPTDENFAEQLSELVKSTVESTPILRAQGQAPTRAVPARSGAEVPGGSGNAPQLTMSDLDAMAQNGQFEAIDEARRSGRLSHLLGG